MASPIGVGVGDIILAINTGIRIYQQIRGAPAQVKLTARLMKQLGRNLVKLEKVVDDPDGLLGKNGPEPEWAPSVRETMGLITDDVNEVNTLLEKFELRRKAGLGLNVRFIFLGDLSRIQDLGVQMDRYRLDIDEQLQIITVRGVGAVHHGVGKVDKGVGTLNEKVDDLLEQNLELKRMIMAQNERTKESKRVDERKSYVRQKVSEHVSEKVLQEQSVPKISITYLEEEGIHEAETVNAYRDIRNVWKSSKDAKQPSTTNNDGKKENPKLGDVSSTNRKLPPPTIVMTLADLGKYVDQAKQKSNAPQIKGTNGKGQTANLGGTPGKYDRVSRDPARPSPDPIERPSSAREAESRNPWTYKEKITKEGLQPKSPQSPKIIPIRARSRSTGTASATGAKGGKDSEQSSENNDRTPSKANLTPKVNILFVDSANTGRSVVAAAYTTLVREWSTRSYSFWPVVNIHSAGYEVSSHIRWSIHDTRKFTPHLYNNQPEALTALFEGTSIKSLIGHLPFTAIQHQFQNHKPVGFRKDLFTFYDHIFAFDDNILRAMQNLKDRFRAVEGLASTPPGKGNIRALGPYRDLSSFVWKEFATTLRPAIRRFLTEDLGWVSPLLIDVKGERQVAIPRSFHTEFMETKGLILALSRCDDISVIHQDSVSDHDDRVCVRIAGTGAQIYKAMDILKEMLQQKGDALLIKGQAS